MPSLSSSPRMRLAPHRGLRPAVSRMSAARVVGGRPDRPERRRQNARNPARCQRRMVLGWMSRVASRQAGATRAARTIVKRCQGVHRTRPARFRLATMSCCRRSAFSATSSTRRERDPRPVRKRIEEGRSRVESYTVRAVGICSQDGGDQRHHLETAAENHLEEGGVAAGDKSQAAAKPSGEAELTRYETAVQQHILGGNDALDHRSTSSGKAKCSTRAPRSLRSGDRFWAATSLYLISGVSNATCRRRRGRGVMLAHHRNRSGRQTMKVIEHYKSAIESSMTFIVCLPDL